VNGVKTAKATAVPRTTADSTDDTLSKKAPKAKKSRRLDDSMVETITKVGDSLAQSVMCLANKDSRSQDAFKQEMSSLRVDVDKQWRETQEQMKETQQQVRETRDDIQKLMAMVAAVIGNKHQ
jgi:Mg2+ and Co2+ transporter CorA